MHAAFPCGFPMPCIMTPLYATVDSLHERQLETPPPSRSAWYKRPRVPGCNDHWRAQSSRLHELQNNQYTV